jgi:hypothetical protein
VLLCFNGHGLYDFCKSGTLHLLGDAGHLQEAENVVMVIPYKPHVAAWMALLGTCRIHGKVEMAECVAK